MTPPGTGIEAGIETKLPASKLQLCNDAPDDLNAALQQAATGLPPPLGTRIDFMSCWPAQLCSAATPLSFIGPTSLPLEL